MSETNVTQAGPKYFQFDQIPWPESEPEGTPQELVDEAKRLGARRKLLAAARVGSSRRSRSSRPATWYRCTATGTTR